MESFDYVRPASLDEALAAAGEGARFLAGGTNLVDLMKAGVERPRRLVDLRRLPLAGIAERGDGGIRIGALAANSDCADHAIVRARYPLLAEALLAGASPQLRNMATVGGNLLQRTRCHYFVDPAFGECNKRSPGSGCAARSGEHRIHAIFGASAQCVATNPSDMAVALAALDAVLEVRSPVRTRRLALADLHRLPGGEPQRDHVLEPEEVIVAVDLPPPRFGDRCKYLKVRDRASFAFALVSVAVALDIRGEEVRDARIVLGGVAHKPWRALAAERRLIGRRLDAHGISAAAGASIEGAEPLPGNAFKVELARRVVERALRAAGNVE